MTTCLISVFLQGTSAAQAVAADESVKQCPSAVSESVCQPDPTQHSEKGVVTLGRGKGKISGKRMTHNPMLSLYIQVQDAGVQPIFFALALIALSNQVLILQLMDQFIENFYGFICGKDATVYTQLDHCKLQFLTLYV